MSTIWGHLISVTVDGAAVSADAEDAASARKPLLCAGRPPSGHFRLQSVYAFLQSCLLIGKGLQRSEIAAAMRTDRSTQLNILEAKSRVDSLRSAPWASAEMENRLRFTGFVTVLAVEYAAPAFTSSASRTYGPPRCKRYLRDDLPVCVNVFGLMGSLPWPRWRSARSGPHRFDGVVRHSDYQGYEAQVDFQAILFFTTCSQVGRSAHGMRCDLSNLSCRSGCVRRDVRRYPDRNLRRLVAFPETPGVEDDDHTDRADQQRQDLAPSDRAR